MLDSLTWLLGAAVVLLFLAKRFIRRRQSLQNLLQASKSKTAQIIEKTQEEHQNLIPEAALQPVRAGLLEILDFVPNPPQFNITPRELELKSANYNLKIVWLQRQTTLSAVQRHKQIKGKGHWQVVNVNRPSQVWDFTDLATLMHFLQKTIENNQIISSRYAVAAP